MQLPFLDKKRIAGSIIGKVQKTTEEPKEESLEISEELKAAAEDLINAIHSKDTNKAATALKSAFMILESEEQE